MSQAVDLIDFFQEGKVKFTSLKFSTKCEHLKNASIFLFIRTPVPEPSYFKNPVITYLASASEEYYYRKFKWHIITMNEIYELYKNKSTFSLIDERFFKELDEGKGLWVDCEYSNTHIQNPNMGMSDICFSLRNNKNVYFNFHAGMFHNDISTTGARYRNTLLVGIDEQSKPIFTNY